MLEFGEARVLSGFGFDPEEGTLSPDGFFWSLTGAQTKTAQGKHFILSDVASLPSTSTTNGPRASLLCACEQPTVHEAKNVRAVPNIEEIFAGSMIEQQRRGQPQLRKYSMHWLVAERQAGTDTGKTSIVAQREITTGHLVLMARQLLP